MERSRLGQRLSWSPAQSRTAGQGHVQSFTDVHLLLGGVPPTSSPPLLVTKVKTQPHSLIKYNSPWLSI